METPWRRLSISVFCRVRANHFHRANLLLVLVSFEEGSIRYGGALTSGTLAMDHLLARLYFLLAGHSRSPSLRLFSCVLRGNLLTEGRINCWRMVRVVRQMRLILNRTAANDIVLVGCEQVAMLYHLGSHWEILVGNVARGRKLLRDLARSLLLCLLLGDAAACHSCNVRVWGSSADKSSLMGRHTDSALVLCGLWQSVKDSQSFSWRLNLLVTGQNELILAIFLFLGYDFAICLVSRDLSSFDFEILRLRQSLLRFNLSRSWLGKFDSILKVSFGVYWLLMRSLVDELFLTRSLVNGWHHDGLGTLLVILLCESNLILWPSWAAYGALSIGGRGCCWLIPFVISILIDIAVAVILEVSRLAHADGLLTDTGMTVFQCFFAANHTSSPACTCFEDLRQHVLLGIHGFVRIHGSSVCAICFIWKHRHWMVWTTDLVLDLLVDLACLDAFLA